MDSKNPKGAGRKPLETPKVRVRATLPKAVEERLIKLRPTPAGRAKLVEAALELYMDIIEGKRNLPELLTSDTQLGNTEETPS